MNILPEVQIIIIELTFSCDIFYMDSESSSNLYMCRYQDTYNYFDPDNFISIASMVYSGNPYLQEQSRLVVERSGA